MSVNKVFLVGYLGADPESRSFPNGGSICNLRLATSESWKDKNSGERKERTEWHRVVLRNKLGEIAQQYLRKGSLVHIEGRIQTRKWQDQNGQDKYSTEIIGTEMKMLGQKLGGSDSGSSASNQAQPAGANAGPDYGSGDADYYDDDIPF